MSCASCCGSSPPRRCSCWFFVWRIRGPPPPAILLGLWLAQCVLLQHSRFGRYLYAIGGNEEAAVLSGVPVRRVVVGALHCAWWHRRADRLSADCHAGASTTTVGELMGLNAVAACVIGGPACAAVAGRCRVCCLAA